MKVKAPPKHQMIVGHLRHRILTGALKPGEMIPSYRTLMEEHGATVNTVRQAMMALQADGLVESRAGVGCLVSTPETKRLMVGIASIGYSDGDGMHDFLSGQLQMLHDELDRLGCDITLRFMRANDEASLDALVAWAKRWDGILLTGRVPVSVVETVADAGVLLVQLGEPYDLPCPPGISRVTVDVHNMVHLGVSHLVALGHRRIALCSCRGSRYFELVAESFRRSIAEYGLDTDVPEWTFPANNKLEWPEFLPWLKSQVRPPTALLVEEGTRATSLVRVLNANGWPVPERMSVMGISAARRQPRSMEGLTSVLSSTPEMILHAARMLTEMIQSGGTTARVEKVVSMYVPGSTCAAPGGRTDTR